MSGYGQPNIHTRLDDEHKSRSVTVFPGLFSESDLRGSTAATSNAVAQRDVGASLPRCSENCDVHGWIGPEL
eukprot:365472-Chlamydomonas_euryale.AAC.4